MTNPISDIENAACILAVGADIAETHPVIALEIQKAVRKGSKLVVINSRRTGLVERADTWLHPLPGSDVALLTGMARVIVDEGLEDKAFIEDRCEDYEAFRASLEGLSLDMAAQVTGVPRESIVRAARAFATRKPASILYTQDSHSPDSVLAMANLVMLTGNVGQPASGVNPLRSQGNAQGCCDMGALPDMLPGYQSVADAQARSRFETAWGCRLKADPGLTLMEMFDAIHEGRIKAMYLLGETPALSEPNIRHGMSAVEKLEFLVVQDMFLTETAQQADVVLPACSFAEKDGTFTNTERRIQRVRKAINPVGDSRPDWWITCQVARRMGGVGFDFDDPSQIMDEIARLAPIYGGVSYQRLDDGSLLWPCPSQDHPGTSYLHGGGFAHGKGRFTPLTYEDSRESPGDDYPLMLTAGPGLRRFQTDGLTRRVKGSAGLAWTGVVELNPEDAGGLEVAEGDTVRLVSRRGQLVATARVTGATPPRVAYMAFDHAGEDPPGVSTDDASGPVADILEDKVCAVRVEKAVEAADV
jgi:predicted molibdopterin-dependent oxidoreductase YjgC